MARKTKTPEAIALNANAELYGINLDPGMIDDHIFVTMRINDNNVKLTIIAEVVGFYTVLGFDLV